MKEHNQMKKILFFYQESCPFCIRARQHLRDLQHEHPEYQQLDIEFIDENLEAERAATYDYYFVPTLYVDGVKVHEGVLRRVKLEEILANAVQEQAQ
jgi:glutaredoxin